jgi:hypothetical protein
MVVDGSGMVQQLLGDRHPWNDEMFEEAWLGFFSLFNRLMRLASKAARRGSLAGRSQIEISLCLSFNSSNLMRAGACYSP